jgi:phage shock protein E
MEKAGNYLYIGLIGFFIFNFFFKNQAEADAKKSYENYLAGKAIFVDVREEAEVKDGMIKGAHWISLSKFEINPKKEIEQLAKLSWGKEIYVYCRSGNRSGRVQSLLKDAGVDSVNMGGYSSLVKEDIPTQPGPQ